METFLSVPFLKQIFLSGNQPYKALVDRYRLSTIAFGKKLREFSDEIVGEMRRVLHLWTRMRVYTAAQKCSRILKATFLFKIQLSVCNGNVKVGKFGPVWVVFLSHE